MKTLYYFIHLTGRDKGNTGIQRVVRNLGFALQELQREDLQIVPVRWDAQNQSIVHVEHEFNEGIGLFGGPLFSVLATPGSAIPPALSEEDWLLIPEVPHLRSHDPRFPSVQIGAVIGKAKSLGLRVASIFYDILPLDHSDVIGEGALNRYQFMLYAYSLVNVDLLIPISYSCKFALNQWLMLNGVSADQLPCSADISLPEEMRGVERRIPTTDNRTTHKSGVFISLGTVCTRKNQLLAMEAFDRVRRKLSKFNLRFEVVGHVDPEMAASARQALSLTEGHITISGYLSDERVQEMMIEARASVFVSLAEGFGLPVAESLWMGLPCICSNTGAVAEIAAGGGCLTVDPTDVTAIAAAFERLLLDENLHQKLLREIATRPLRSWKDYAREIIDSIFQNQPFAAFFVKDPEKVVKITADQLFCHKTYFQDGLQRLRNGNSILFTRSAHGPVEEAHLFHGPYISMKAGNYKVYIDGELSGSLTLQFLSGGGNTECECVVQDFDVPLSITLASNLNDFEIRGVRRGDTERVWLKNVIFVRVD